MLTSALSDALNFQAIMLLVLVIGMNVISVSVLIHGVNAIYKVLGGNGALLLTPEERREQQARQRWNARQEKQARWRAERRERQANERRDRDERAFVSSILDREVKRRQGQD